MKNIILQHWTGDMIELTELSSANISKYAANIGADYNLLRGNVFNPKLRPACQKLFMLDESWDDYDMVVMLDPDMFTRKGMEKNIFTDANGYGRHTEFQADFFKNLQRKFPKLTNPRYPFWGGAIYRLDREIRQKLRVHIRENEMMTFCQSHFFDEGCMHRLAMLADFKPAVPYFTDNSWDCGNFEPEVTTCSIIHVRTKITPKGPKRPKIENYRELVSKGIIEK